MAIFEVIKWDDPSSASNDVIVYKHEAEDFNTSSQLIVHQNQLAVFFQNGTHIQTFGPGRHELTTSNVPGFRGLIKKVFGGKEVFHCDIFFINKVVMDNILWGFALGSETFTHYEQNQVGDADMQRISKFTFHYGARGSYDIEISDVINAHKLLEKKVGTQGVLTKNDIKNIVWDKVVEQIKNTLGEAISASKVDIDNLASCYPEVASKAAVTIKEWLLKTYGITLVDFRLLGINISSEDRKKYDEDLAERRKMNLQAQAEENKIAAEVSKMKRMGYTYQDETQRQVLSAAASNEGQAGTFMGAGMGLGMGMGLGAGFGGAMGNMAQQAFTQQPQQPQQPKGTACSKCGTMVPEGQKFCSNCGNQMGSFCPGCGSAIEPNAKFCMNCGKKLTANCGQCGAELPPNTKFCPNCGNKVE